METIEKGEDFSQLWDPIYVDNYTFHYGFWEYKRKGTGHYSLTRVSTGSLLRWLGENGFYKLRSGSKVLLREENARIEKVTVEQVKEFVGDYLVSINDSGFDIEYNGHKITTTKRKIEDTYYDQQYRVLNDKMLDGLTVFSKEVLRDNETTCYIPYRNLVVQITAKRIDFLNYTNLSGKVVWTNHIVHREINENIGYSGSEYVKLLQNLSNHNSDRFTAFKSAHGYLIHTYTSPSNAKAVILYDEEISDPDAPAGGTGKGMVIQAVGQIREVVTEDGRRFDTKNKFCYQNVNETTQILCLDDVSNTIGFENLFSTITDGMQIEQKGLRPYSIAPEFCPKFLITSNSIISSEGSSNKRRQYPIELSNHYSKKIEKGTEEPVLEEHGKMFFKGVNWTQADWQGFDHFCIESVRHYLENGLHDYERRNISANALKQKVGVDFLEWVNNQGYQPNMEYQTEEHFQKYKTEVLGCDTNAKQRGFSNKLKAFAKEKGWNYSTISSNGTQYFIFEPVVK